MWKLIIFNGIWFGALVSAHFFRVKFWRAAALGALFLFALIFAVRKSLDPFAWIYYFLFSLLVFWSGLQFKRWASFKRMVLDEEMDLATRRLNIATELLQKKSLETEVIQHQANDIHYIYDKIKEMSQCLDPFEAFLVFGEALSGQLKFQSITLALFNEEDKESRIPQEIYRLERQDYDGVFDKTYFLNHREKFQIGATPLLCKIFERGFLSREPVSVTGSTDDSSDDKLSADLQFAPFVATPIFIEKSIFGVLILSGIGSEQFPALLILTERFIAEAERIKLYEKVGTLAITDGLTGVHVRRHLLERLEGEINRSRKFGFDLSFLMVDVDHFKRFNDQYGHLVGDEVLRQLADTIRKNVRELDLVGRYGGEEFGVLLVETNRSGAAFAAERIRFAIAEKKIKAYDENLKATVSIGCATFPKAQAETGVVLEIADQALYDAKHHGRNRVCAAP